MEDVDMPSGTSVPASIPGTTADLRNDAVKMVFQSSGVSFWPYHSTWREISVSVAHSLSFWGSERRAFLNSIRVPAGTWETSLAARSRSADPRTVISAV